MRKELSIVDDMSSHNKWMQNDNLSNITNMFSQFICWLSQQMTFDHNLHALNTYTRKIICTETSIWGWCTQFYSWFWTLHGVKASTGFVSFKSIDCALIFDFNVQIYNFLSVLQTLAMLLSLVVYLRRYIIQTCTPNRV